MDVNIKVTFFGGKGRLSVTINSDDFRKVDRTFEISGSIKFENINKGDIISLDGVSPSGGTKVEIDTETNPPTPETIPVGDVMRSYYVK